MERTSSQWTMRLDKLGGSSPWNVSSRGCIVASLRCCRAKSSNTCIYCSPSQNLHATLQPVYDAGAVAGDVRRRLCQITGRSAGREDVFRVGTTKLHERTRSKLGDPLLCCRSQEPKIFCCLKRAAPCFRHVVFGQLRPRCFGRWPCSRGSKETSRRRTRI